MVLGALLHGLGKPHLKLFTEGSSRQAGRLGHHALVVRHIRSCLSQNKRHRRGRGSHDYQSLIADH